VQKTTFFRDNSGISTPENRVLSIVKPDFLDEHEFWPRVDASGCCARPRRRNRIQLVSYSDSGCLVRCSLQPHEAATISGSMNFTGSV